MNLSQWMSLGVGAISKWDIFFTFFMTNGANRSISTVIVCGSLCECGVQCIKVNQGLPLVIDENK